MAEKPEQPRPGAPIKSVHSDAEGNLHQHGIPIHATDEEPKGLPTSDRHHSETAAHADGGDASVAKHEHGAAKVPRR